MIGYALSLGLDACVIPILAPPNYLTTAINAISTGTLVAYMQELGQALAGILTIGAKRGQAGGAKIGI